MNVAKSILVRFKYRFSRTLILKYDLEKWEGLSSPFRGLTSSSLVQLYTYVRPDFFHILKVTYCNRLNAEADMRICLLQARL